MQDCIRYAVEQNLTLQQNKLTTRQDETDLKQRKMSRLPSLNATASQGFRFGRNIDPYTNTFVQQSINSNTFSLNAKIPVFEGFKLQNQIESSQLGVKASKASDEATKNEIKLTVTSYYMDVLLQREKLKNARSKKDRTRQMLEKTRLLVESGKVNKTEAMELKAQLASDESQLVQAKNKLKVAQLTLRQYMNWEEDQKLNIKAVPLPDSLKPVQQKKPETVFQENIKRLPRIKQAQYQLMSTDYSLKAAKANRYPSISLNASISSGYSSRNRQPDGFNRSLDTVGFVAPSESPVLRQTLNPEFSTVPFWDQIDNNFSQVVSLQLDIPIFNNYSIQNQIENAKIQQSKAKINLSREKQNLEKTIQQAYVKANNAHEQYLAAKKQLEAQQNLFDQSNLLYEEGAMNFYDWQANKHQLREAQNNYLQAKYRFLFNKKRYAFYLGDEIALNNP